MRVDLDRNANKALHISNPSTPLHRLPCTPTDTKPNLLKHSHPPERFRAIFERMLQVLHDGLLSYSLFYPPLCFNVVRVGVERLDLALPRQFGLVVPFLQLPEERSESLGRTFRRLSKLGLGLSYNRNRSTRGRGEGWDGVRIEMDGPVEGGATGLGCPISVTASSRHRGTLLYEIGLTSRARGGAGQGGWATERV